MKTRLGLIVLAGAALGIGWWAIARPKSPASKLQYAIYRGQEAPLLIEVEHPSSWAVFEEKGQRDPYRKVRFTGPRNADGVYSAYISIIGEPMKQFGGRYENIRQMQEALMEHAPLKSRLLSEAKKRVGGVEGVEISRAFTIPALHHKGLKPKEVAAQERVVLLEQSPYLYQFVYSADERDAKRLAGVFDKILESFRFL